MPESEHHIWRGGTWSSRALLAMMAMLGTWLLSSLVLLALRLTLEPGLEVAPLAAMSALVAGYSYALFAMPVSAAFPRRLQLRFDRVLVLLALVWSTLVFRMTFQEWPWSSMRHSKFAATFWLLWFGSFTLCAVLLYLFLLRRGERLDRPSSVSSEAISS